MAALVPALAGVLAVAWLLWEPLTARYRVQGRHSVRLIVKRWHAEEAAYQAALDRVWAGAIADMAERATHRREIAWR